MKDLKSNDVKERASKKISSWTDAGVRAGVTMAVLMWVAMWMLLMFAAGSDARSGFKLASSKDLLTPTVAATGVLIAVLAYLRDRGKIERDRADAKSKIMYEQCKQGMADGYEMLKDQNNDRIIWVRAARVLQRATTLAESISSPEYKLAYELARESMRNQLFEALTLRGEGGGRDPLPPAFFFGHPEWRTTRKTLDAIALDTSAQVRVRAVYENSTVPDMPTKNLSVHSVKVVFSYLEYPEDYKDPLDTVDWTDVSKWSDSSGPQQGARKYLLHKTQKVAIGDKLVERTRKPSG